MDPALMFLLHDSLNSNVEYLRTELVRQVSLVRSAQADANKFQSLYRKGEEATKILKTLRADIEMATENVRKDLEKKYTDKFQKYTMECAEQTEKLIRSQMQNEMAILREEVEMHKRENVKLIEKNAELCAQVQDLHTALVQEETQRSNLIVYIEEVLKANNLTLSSPQRNSLSTLSASFNLITSPTKKLEFGSPSQEKDKVDSLILLEQKRQASENARNNKGERFVDSIDSVTSNEIKNYPFKAASTPTESAYENFLPQSFAEKICETRSSADGESQQNNFLADFEVLETHNIFDELSAMETSFPDNPHRNTRVLPNKSNETAPQVVQQSKRGFLGFYRKNKEPTPHPGKKLSFFRNPFRRGINV